MKTQITKEIETVFEGVKLDGGTSLEQTRVIDNYGRGCSVEQFTAIPFSEEIGDWRKIPASALNDADCVAHLDRKGFKYYIPALMLRLLDNYDGRDSMMRIGTLSILYPKTESWAYLYSLLSPIQLRSIAHFLEALPELIELEGEDKTVVERALRNYWSRYLD